MDPIGESKAFSKVKKNVFYRIWNLLAHHCQSWLAGRDRQREQTQVYKE